jgi:hypothetical protein
MAKNDYTFFDQSWADWQPVSETTPVDPEDYLEWLADDSADTSTEPTATVYEFDPLDDEGLSDDIRNSITSFRAWGQGPVQAAMDKLEINSVNDLASANQVLDWLSENYGSLLDKEDDYDIPEFENYVYTPVQMDLTYEPKYTEAELQIKKATGPIRKDQQPTDSTEYVYEYQFGVNSRSNSIYE